MKNFLVLLLVIAMCGNAMADPACEDLGPAVVGAAASHIDTLGMDILSMLQIAAETPEAKNGNWPGIRPYLEKAAGRAPGVYFYVLPDGNYYSLDKNFTNLNLSSRGYFRTLFEGTPVKGYEVYSRSTGRKSAVMAAPITAGGKVVGALGASIFLDDLHSRLNAQLNLPEDYTWFVVNRDGVVILDSDEDFMFMNALTQGGDSLKRAILESLKGERGHIRYEIGGNVRDAEYRKLPSLEWWMILAKKEQSPGKAQITLTDFVPKLQESLDAIDYKTRNLLSNAKLDWDHQGEIRKTLKSALEASSLIFEAVYVNEKGFIRYIEPPEYVNHEGSDIHTQEHEVEVIGRQVPVFSSSFQAVEGFPAVVIAYPVRDETGKFRGSLNILIRPKLMLQSLLKEVKMPADQELWVMQKDGTLIYVKDSRDIAKNLFTDPDFRKNESLLKLAHGIAATPNGVGDYVHGHALRAASWGTVSLYGREWRVVLERPIK